MAIALTGPLETSSPGTRNCSINNMFLDCGKRDTSYGSSNQAYYLGGELGWTSQMMQVRAAGTEISTAVGQLMSPRRLVEKMQGLEQEQP